MFKSYIGFRVRLSICTVAYYLRFYVANVKKIRKKDIALENLSGQLGSSFDQRAKLFLKKSIPVIQCYMQLVQFHSNLFTLFQLNLLCLQLVLHQKFIVVQSILILLKILHALYQNKETKRGQNPCAPHRETFSTGNRIQFTIT